MRNPMGLTVTVAFVAMLPATCVAHGNGVSEPAQVPFCMIGDSITWAGEGDSWRADLLEHLPQLAFVGTHTAKFGYSHAGEGGNTTREVLERLDDVPDCPYYHLLIGTNDSSRSKEPEEISSCAQVTAERIEQIVHGLLKKPSVRKIFLASLLPCQTNNPLRDQTNAATNVLLRKKLKTTLASDKITWVEYEIPIRAIPNWGPMIRLHPTPKGYELLAKTLAKTLARELGLALGGPAPKAGPGTGVRVENLWDDAGRCTRAPVIAGWYTVSFEIAQMAGPAPAITARSMNKKMDVPLNRTIPLNKDAVAGQRAAVHFFTGYEGYGYTRAVLTIEPAGCKIDKILFEKSRPSKKASTYGQGSYIDTLTPPEPGELLESP